jgi:acetyl esterase
LNPQVQVLLDALQGRAPIHAGTVSEARGLSGALTARIGPGPGVQSVREVECGRLYSVGSEALIVYFHGGGWVMGALDDFDALCRSLAVASGLDVLSIDYRLAPEHPFPAAYEDAVAASTWAGERPLVLAGDSAGGNLAAAVALTVPAALQVLIYPVLDHAFDTDSYLRHGSGYLLGREDMIWFWNHYAPVAVRDDPRASPLRAVDLSGAPPLLLVSAEYDPLLDEGRAYAARLEAAGVPVEVQHYDDVTHGFFRLVGMVDRAGEAVGRVGEAIRRAL